MWGPLGTPSGTGGPPVLPQHPTGWMHGPGSPAGAAPTRPPSTTGWPTPSAPPDARPGSRLAQASRAEPCGHAQAGPLLSGLLLGDGGQPDERDPPGHRRLVLVVGRALGHERVPQSSAVDLGHPAGEAVDPPALDLRRTARVRLQVQPPLRLGVDPAVRGGDHEVVAVPDVEDRGGERLPGAAPGVRHQQDVPAAEGPDQPPTGAPVHHDVHPRRVLADDGQRAVLARVNRTPPKMRASRRSKRRAISRATATSTGFAPGMRRIVSTGRPDATQPATAGISRGV